MLFFLNITFIDNLTAIAVIFLCLFSIFLYYENKKLNQIIEDLKSRNKDRYEKNIIKEDIVSINDISKVVKDNDEKNSNSENKIVKSNIVEIDKNKDKDLNNQVKDSKSVIINNKKKEFVSNKIIDDKENNDVNRFDIEDFIMKDKYINRKLDSSDMNSEYLQAVSRELEGNMAPQTIKLTDYEQEQEDNAIISYKELLNANNRQTETINDGTVEFIEELKKFRNNLGE